MEQVPVPSLTLIVDQNLHLSMLHHTDTAVRCTQINTDNGAIVLDIGLGIHSLDESRREEGEEESEQSKAQGQVAPRSASHCVKSVRKLPLGCEM